MTDSRLAATFKQDSNTWKFLKARCRFIRAKHNMWISGLSSYKTTLKLSILTPLPPFVYHLPRTQSRGTDPHSKHWFTTSFLGGGCRKAMFRVWHPHTHAVSHSEHRFPAPSAKEGCRKPVLGIWRSSLWPSRYRSLFRSFCPYFAATLTFQYRWHRLCRQSP